MWGFWEQRGVGMTAHLGRAELMRMRRLGVLPLSPELGLELLDVALTRPEAVLIPLHLDLDLMQRQFGGAEVPALYRGLLRSGLKRASAASADANALRARLAALASEGERLQALVEMAREDIAAVLALPGASSVPADAQLKELGLDSLMAVALRNRLSERIGIRLPTTVAFDYPTARAMAQLMLEKLSLNARATLRQDTVAGAAAVSKAEWLRSVEVLLRSADPELLRQLDLDRRLAGLADMGALLEESESSCIVPIRPGFGNRVMLYIPGLAHGATRGNTPPVITQLGGDYPIAGLNPYPLAARGLLSGSIADLASSYLPHVESWIGDRSAFFVGSSFGGLVAMAVASELERRGRHVDGVILLDTLTPNNGTLPLPIDELQDMACAYLTRLYGLAEHEGERLAELTGAPSIAALREMIGDNYRCHKGWTLPVLAAPVHLLHAQEFVETPGLSPEEHALPDLGWSRFGLELASVAIVPGNHTSMYTHPDMPGHIDALFEPDLADRSPAPDVGIEAADRSGDLRGAAE
jgi:thioesterase domain-containing protein/acyl carrier protein